MDIRMLRRLFQEGTLVSATIMPAPMEPDRWLLGFEKNSGGQEWITKTRSDIGKAYKWISDALVDVEYIGFQEVKIKLKQEQILNPRPHGQIHKWPGS
ncbi:MAG: hypothetical protein M3H12_19770 [Chromatiales bacterium]|nr:plasmid replication protein RepB [Gammaproteobacteria bacterium]